MTGGWNDDEAIEQERHDADLLQAQYEAESNAFVRQQRRAKALFEAGDLEGAAEMCGHDGGYPLDSLAAEYANDPGLGREGVRCGSCGSHLSRFPYEGEVTIIAACEIPGMWA